MRGFSLLLLTLGAIVTALAVFDSSLAASDRSIAVAQLFIGGAVVLAVLSAQRPRQETKRTAHEETTAE